MNLSLVAEVIADGDDRLSAGTGWQERMCVKSVSPDMSGESPFRGTSL